MPDVYIYLSIRPPSLSGRSECRVNQVNFIYRCLLMIVTKCSTESKGHRSTNLSRCWSDNNAASGAVFCWLSKNHYFFLKRRTTNHIFTRLIRSFEFQQTSRQSDVDARRPRRSSHPKKKIYPSNNNLRTRLRSKRGVRSCGTKCPLCALLKGWQMAATSLCGHIL